MSQNSSMKRSNYRFPDSGDILCNDMLGRDKSKNILLHIFKGPENLSYILLSKYVIERQSRLF